MITLTVIIWIVMVIALAGIVAVHPLRTNRSSFELERRGDVAATRRERLLADIFALRRFMLVLLIIGVSALGVSLWGWQGVLVTGLIVLTALHLSRVSIVRKRVDMLYKKHELRLLDIVEKFPIIGTILAAERRHIIDPQLESPEQLLHLVASAGHLLTTEQQDIISHGLEWHAVSVHSVMTRRADIVAIKHSELLGPLVLHDLHESGHAAFPVIKKDIDHIIGTVDITGLLEVDKIKNSHTAEHQMVPGIVTVMQDVSLPSALELLISSRKPFLIVLDADDATSGLVTINDILGALLGKNRGEVVL